MLKSLEQSLRFSSLVPLINLVISTTQPWFVQDRSGQSNCSNLSLICLSIFTSNAFSILKFLESTEYKSLLKHSLPKYAKMLTSLLIGKCKLKTQWDITMHTLNLKALANVWSNQTQYINFNNIRCKSHFGIYSKETTSKIHTICKCLQKPYAEKPVENNQMSINKRISENGVLLNNKNE